MTINVCDNEKCQHNDNKLCLLNKVYLAKGKCTKANKNKQSINDIMKPSFVSNCQKTSGGYKTKHGKIIK